MKGGLGFAYILFCLGVGMSIANHEASLWVLFWKAFAWPGYAGYEVAQTIFHYAQSEPHP